MSAKLPSVLLRGQSETFQNFVFKLKFTHLFFRFNSFFKVNKKLVVNLILKYIDENGGFLE